MKSLKRELTNYDSGIEKTVPEYSAKLGKTPTVVAHPTRNGFCYARMADNLDELIVVFNDQVSQIYDLPILVSRRGNTWYVVGRDSLRYIDWGTSASYIPIHHRQHEFNRDEGTGADTVFVYPDQFMPLLVYPSGTNGASNLMIAPYLLQRTSDFVYVGNTGTINLLIYKPLTNQAIMGLVYLDKTTGNPGILINSGTPFNSSITGTGLIAPFVPYPNSNQEPLYAFRLVSGTTVINWPNLYNARQFIGGSTSTGSSGGSLPALAPSRVVITDTTGTITTNSLFYYLANNLYLGAPTQFPGLNGIAQQSAFTKNSMESYDDDPLAPSTINFIKGRGSLGATTPVVNNDILGRLSAKAVDLNDQIGADSIFFDLLAAETHSTTKHGTKGRLRVTETGTLSKVHDFEFTNAGNINLNSGTYNINGVPHTHTGSSSSAIPNIISGGYVTRSGGNLIFLPDKGIYVFCYESGAWAQKLIPTTTGSVACTGLTGSTAYYLYAYDNGGTLTLDLSQTAPTTQDGIFVKTGVTNRTLIARCYTNSSGAVVTFNEDTSKHFLNNVYNKRLFSIQKEETTANWTYNSTTLHPLNNNSANKVEFVADGQNLVLGHISITVLVNSDASLSRGIGAIGLDSTSVNASDRDYTTQIGGAYAPSVSNYKGIPSAGYHYLQALEKNSVAAVTCNFYGSQANSECKIFADLWA